MRRATSLRRSPGEQSNIVGDRVRLARQSHTPPLTMEETSRRVLLVTGHSITKNMIVKIENNQRSVYDYEVKALAAALDVDVRFLLGIVNLPGCFNDAESVVRLNPLSNLVEN